MPTRALSNKTPYEVWTGDKPDIGHVKVFGCIAHMKVPSVHTKKLDDRSKMVVYLGKEAGTKACRLYDPDSGKIFVSRDVVFEETRCWDWEERQHDTPFTREVLTVVGVQNEEGTQNREMEVPVTPERSNTVTASNSDTPTDSTSLETGEHSVYSETSSSDGQNFRLISDIYDETQEIELENELLLLGIDEPSNYSQAAEEQAWVEAMKSEIDAIERNKTWKLVELPSGAKPIGLKWVYKLKRDTDGKILKHKARLVAKGYVQKQGIDFEEVFAPVTRLETVRLLLALAAKNGWEVHHLDVKSAFLNGAYLSLKGL